MLKDRSACIPLFRFTGRNLLASLLLFLPRVWPRMDGGYLSGRPGKLCQGCSTSTDLRVKPEPMPCFTDPLAIGFGKMKLVIGGGCLP